jgi:hypothetical protein
MSSHSTLNLGTRSVLFEHTGLVSGCIGSKPHFRAGPNAGAMSFLQSSLFDPLKNVVVSVSVKELAAALLGHPNSQ